MSQMVGVGECLQCPGEATALWSQCSGAAKPPHVSPGWLGPACRMGLDREGVSTGKPVREMPREFRGQRTSYVFGFQDHREDGLTTPLI